jgi:hypothetical protein
MKLHCFLINNQLVVIQELSQLAQVHFIRGEKSTNILEWNVQDWQDFNNYLQGSFGLECLNDIKIQLIYSRTKKSPIEHFKQTFKHAKAIQHKDVDAFQDFDPLTLQVRLKNKSSDIVTWLNQMLFPKKVAPVIETKLTKEKPKAQLKANQNKIETLIITPFYEKTILAELQTKTLSKKNKPIEGVANGVTGSGFYIFVEGYKVFVAKQSIKQNLPTNKEIADYVPVEGDVIELQINDNHLQVLLKEKVKDNA